MKAKNQSKLYISVEGDHEGERGDEPDNCQLEPGSSLFCSPGNNTALFVTDEFAFVHAIAHVFVSAFVFEHRSPFVKIQY